MERSHDSKQVDASFTFALRLIKSQAALSRGGGGLLFSLTTAAPDRQRESGENPPKTPADLKVNHGDKAPPKKGEGSRG